MPRTNINGSTGEVTMANKRFNADWYSATHNITNGVSTQAIFGPRGSISRSTSGSVEGTVTGVLVYDDVDTQPFPTTPLGAPDFANFNDTLTLGFAPGCSVTGEAAFSNISWTSDAGSEDFSDISMDYAISEPIYTWDATA